MKKTISILFILGLFLSCSKEGEKTNNPYLPNYAFSIPINMNLPLYSGLLSPINPILISEGGTGVNIIVMKVTDTDFRAWDANCPNQYPSTCSLMKINGVNAKCDCDNFEYSLFTGLGASDYPMKSYYVEVLGNNTIRVYNL